MFEEALVSAIDAVLTYRVALHEARQKRALTVPAYLDGLRAAREAERDLERARGARHSRAFELACRDLGREELLA